MEWIRWVNKLEEAFDSIRLPGAEAQFSMAPATRQAELKRLSGREVPRESAVLILFYPDKGKTWTVFIKRPTDGSVHSGQVAFPGGRVEEADLSYTDTALREAWEEVNINPSRVRVIGGLSKLHIPPSNFDVYPIVGYTTERPDLKGNDEVDRIVEVDVEELLDPETRTSKIIRHRLGQRVEVPCYFIEGEIIWGATAMILGELIALINGDAS
ncbi:MAG: CoA pyrophosphatase [bacterium]|jgi:8-oxo-dGTP pyrophosphatase MutT (NUDIX family)